MQKKAISYVRYSSGSQSEGDSIRRQTEATEEWCAENDAILLDTYEDLGISAFKGKNVERGALGSILDVAKGNVADANLPDDVYLICENLDRLGRDEITKQLTVFLELLAHGVNVVTLMDNKIFYRNGHPKHDAALTAGNLMYSIMVMVRACAAGGA